MLKDSLYWMFSRFPHSDTPSQNERGGLIIRPRST
uniref:Uncharacterized protein n=1 Tax=Rhizophora mucronata TaxID=61149 RepID=A0A2P2K4R1_RHIMU